MRVTKAKGGGDFWLYRSRFGICIGGSHPWVTGKMEKSAGMCTVLNTFCVNQQLKESLIIPTYSDGGNGGQSVCLKTLLKAKVATTEMSDFFKIESRETVVELRCGSCRCGKCPVSGSRYSHRE